MHVLIIGGGIAGVSTATQLASQASKTALRVTLIEPKSYVELRWATIRSFFDASIASSATPSLDCLTKYPNLTHIRSKATALSATSVTLEDGQTLSFDVCLLAVGANPTYDPLIPTTTDRAARLEELKETGEKLLAAPSALIVGGGLIGAELAGDVAGYAQLAGKSVHVTLVHSTPNLAPPLAPHAAGKLQAKLEALGVVVVTGSRAEQRDGDDGEWVVSGTDRKLEGDVVIKTVGVRPVNGGDLVRGIEGAAAAVDDKGWIMTDEFGRVVGAGGTVFAHGDCVVSGGYRTGVQIMNSRKMMAGNLQKVAEAVADGKVASEVTGLQGMAAENNVVVITAGPSAGVAQTPWFTDPFMVPKLKNWTMFTKTTYGQLGLKG